MSDNFKELYANLQRQQEELKKQAQEARAEAIAYVQEIITDFQLKASDFTFAEEPEAEHPRQHRDEHHFLDPEAPQEERDQQDA